MRIIEILGGWLQEKQLLTPRRNVRLKKLRRLKPLNRETMQTSRPHGITSPNQFRR
jgi:hypothetical protein